MPQDSSRRRERRSRSTSSRHDDKKHIKRYERTDRYTKRDYNDDYRDGRRKYRRSRSRSRDYSSRRTNRHRSSRSKSRYRSRTPRSRSRSHNNNNKRSDRISSTRDRDEHKSRHAHKKKSRRSKSTTAERDMTPMPPEPPRISEHDDVKAESSCDNSRSGDEISNINDINLPNENYSTYNTNNNRNSKPNYKSKAETYKYYGDDNNIEELDKEKIQQEMQERLRQHLASEGKIYPPPKPQQASHPFFANDGSFLETFKRMQEQQQMFCQSYIYQPVCNVTTNVASGIELNKFDNHAATNIVTQQQQQQQQPQYQSVSQPIFGKRRGGKILKTGIVEKPRPIQELDSDNVKDAWSMYMQEVKKYKNSACDISSKTRPLLK